MKHWRIWRIKNGQVRLSLHKAQLEVWDAQRRFVFLIMGTQGGKTSFGPWWLWREILRCGAGDYLAVTASYDLFKLKMLPEIRTVFERVLGIARYWAGDKVLELRDPETGRFWAERADDPMWGRVILRSAQAEGGLESATANAAWLDECGQDDFALTAWEAVQRRLSLTQGRVLGTTTPYNLGWLKTEVLDRFLAGDTDYYVVQAPSIVNPAFPKAEFERARRTMPAWKFNMFYRGLFERPAGLIYCDYDENVHLVDPFPLPREWPRYVGIDFGAVNTALVWLAHDTERDALYLYRESLEGGMTTSEHASKAQSHAEHERVVAWVGGAPSEKQQRMDWGECGIPVRAPVVSDVEAGIDRVIARFRNKSLFIFKTCRRVRDELGTYRRELDRNGQPTEKIYDKHKFHLLDALRYALDGVEYGGRPMPRERVVSLAERVEISPF